MGKLNSSTTANQHIDFVRETVRTESAPISVTVTNPVIVLTVADRKELLGLATQIVTQTISQYPASVPVEERITSIFNTLVALAEAK